MDNFSIEVWAESKKPFELAMQIAFVKHSYAVAYRIDDKLGFILYWVTDERNPAPNVMPLPYKMGAEQVTEFVWNWLQSLNQADFEKWARTEPDHDGDNGRGFKVYDESWGHVAGDYKAFVAIKPIWAMYGK